MESLMEARDGGREGKELGKEWREGGRKGGMTRETGASPIFSGYALSGT